MPWLTDDSTGVNWKLLKEKNVTADMNLLKHLIFAGNWNNAFQIFVVPAFLSIELICITVVTR